MCWRRHHLHHRSNMRRRPPLSFLRRCTLSRSLLHMFMEGTGIAGIPAAGAGRVGTSATMAPGSGALGGAVPQAGMDGAGAIIRAITAATTVIIAEATARGAVITEEGMVALLITAAGAVITAVPVEIDSTLPAGGPLDSLAHPWPAVPPAIRRYRTGSSICADWVRRAAQRPWPPKPLQAGGGRFRARIVDAEISGEGGHLTLPP
jgi:hypothetical protein